MTAHEIDPNYSAKIWPKFWKKLKQSGSLTFESCHRTKNGKVFPVEVTVTFFKYKGKEYHCGFARDITERKKMEEELREKEKKWTSLTENTNDIIMIVDNKGELQYINITIPPYTPKETVGKSVYEYVPKEQHDTMRNSLTNVFKTGKPETYEVSSVIPKLGTLWFSTKVVPIKIEENVVNAILISTDITERKKAEDELRENEEKYRDLFENAREAILTLDLKGNITGVNKLVEEYGFKREELIGRSHFDFIAEKSRNKAFKEFERLTQGTPVEGEVEVITPKGNRIVEYRNNPICRGGQIVGIQEILIDVTGRKKAEQQFLNDQMQLKSLASQLTLSEERERRRLAGELHDRIGQALVISKIKLEALRKSGYGKKLDKALDDVCNSLGQTIQDTRTLTFDLGNPILYELGFETAVSHWLTEQIQNKYKIETEFEDDGHPKPLDDDVRTLLFRDVRELLINVVKHAHASKVKVSIAKIDDRIRISVEDNGKGFDAGKIASISANGYGLFSIRHRLEQLGGHLEIESTRGRGCKVTMTAPLKQKGHNNGRNRAISQGNGN
jgi:PAS domain S-box-containing protein